jgi:hypothetical protein
MTQDQIPQHGRNYSIKAIQDMGFAKVVNSRDPIERKEFQRGRIVIFTEHIPGREYDSSHVSQRVIVTLDIGTELGKKVYNACRPSPIMFAETHHG